MCIPDGHLDRISHRAVYRRKPSGLLIQEDAPRFIYNITVSKLFLFCWIDKDSVITDIVKLTKCWFNFLPQFLLKNNFRVGLCLKCTHSWTVIVSKKSISKVGCDFPMGVVTLLLHADFGRNDHREGALHFIFVFQFFTYKYVRFFNWTKNDDSQNQSLAVQALNLWVQLDYHKILEEILILWIYLKVEIKSQCTET